MSLIVQRSHPSLLNQRLAQFQLGLNIPPWTSSRLGNEEAEITQLRDGDERVNAASGEMISQIWAMKFSPGLRRETGETRLQEWIDGQLGFHKAESFGSVSDVQTNKGIIKADAKRSPG